MIIKRQAMEINPNLNSLFGYSKLVRTHNGMGVERIRVSGSLDRMIETCSHCNQTGLIFQHLWLEDGGKPLRRCRCCGITEEEE